jgi:S-adenosylmethionine:tRNA ribosyltransferase-isomerase
MIQNLLDHLDKKVIAVGTTSLRTLESLYWLGVKKADVRSQKSEEVFQWEVYDHAETAISANDALNYLINWMEEKDLDHFTAKTQIIIAPGYHFKIVNGLVTNFHQPQSTLLLLVAAFIGENWRKVYNYALDNNFRFLSYGDGSLLWRDR